MNIDYDENKLIIGRLERLLAGETVEGLRIGDGGIDQEWAERSLAFYKALNGTNERYADALERLAAFPADLTLWIRLGDAGDYRECENIADAAEEISHTHSRAIELFQWREGGLETRDFMGNNYISLYWGDGESDHVRDLDRDEQQYLVRLVRTDQASRGL